MKDREEMREQRHREQLDAQKQMMDSFEGLMNRLIEKM